jgi:DNA-binding protein HU-beta
MMNNMNKAELAIAVARKTGLSRAQAEEAINATIETVTHALVRGDEVKIVGFGTFFAIDRAASETRNPRTGDKVGIPAHRAPKFKASAGLKEAVNNK